MCVGITSDEHEDEYKDNYHQKLLLFDALKNITRAYRNLGGLEVAYDEELKQAESVLHDFRWLSDMPEMQKVEIPDCPVCGSEGEMEDDGNNGWYWCCPNGCLDGPDASTKSKAIELANKYIRFKEE